MTSFPFLGKLLKNLAQRNNGILFTLRKGEIFDTYYNIFHIWWCYLNEINQQENTKFLPFCLFILFRAAKFIKLDDKMVYSASERKAEQKPVK